MANTTVLKNIIEPELERGFFLKYGHLEKMRPKPTNAELRDIFMDMEPDLIGVGSISSILYIGEITTSGYLGSRRGDFHIGAAKKVSEAFSRFSLINHNKTKILQRLHKYYPSLKLHNISCHFIVPEGAPFIKALGYREHLFKVGIMELDKITLPDDVKKLMIGALASSREEMS
jgi:hypothetical protein